MYEQHELSEEVSAFVAGLDAPSRRAMRHLLRCRSCRRRWLAYRAERELPRRARERAVPALEPGPVLRRLGREDPELLRLLGARAARARALLARLLAAPSPDFSQRVVRKGCL